jgi:hypothetical protein
MRRGKKVATVFTGAVTCAAAFTPAADATTTHTAPGKTRVFGPHNCTAGVFTNSLVLYWPSSKHHGPTCVDGTGNWHLGAYFASYCTGDNQGSFITSHLREPYIPASSGTFFRRHQFVSNVIISVAGGAPDLCAG